MKENSMCQYIFRTNKVLLEKLGYIAECEMRSKNKELEHLLKQKVKEFEKEYGEIYL